MVHGDSTAVLARIRRALSPFDRCDLLLVVIPLTLAGGTVVAEAFGVPLEVAIAGSSVVVLLAMIDGQFLNPPSGLDGG